MSRQAKLSWPCQPSSDRPTAPKRQCFDTTERSSVNKDPVPSIAAVCTEHTASCVAYNKGYVGSGGSRGIQGCKETPLFSGVLSSLRRSRRRSLRGVILHVLQNV